MGSHFLDGFVKEMEADGGVREIVGEIGEPWFNPYGDCIQFLTLDHWTIRD
ncbi:MAG: hypothetical protein IT365_29585 [Candidatus Hydrogenedentes bacterium]|nr:hypothetical protein [Candidatus Hydrogenedentota bacterium]